MTHGAAPGEQYTIRQKIFKIFGASFYIYDARGDVLGYCKQKAFRLKEDLRFYTDTSCATELFSMRARSIIDFSTTYDVATPEGQVIASIRRKGLSSIVRDSWQVFDPSGAHAASLQEDSTGMALARRFIPGVAVFSPQRFELITDSNAHAATFRTHFNPFVYRLGIALHADPPPLDLYVILAIGCLIAAIEGRQSSEDSGAGLFSGG